MKGMVLTGFGLPQDVLQLQEVVNPVPMDNQVLIKVKASGLNITDYMPFKEPLAGNEVPAPIQQMYAEGLKAIDRVFGMDLSGVVEAVGKDVQSLKPGDEVYGFTSDWLGAWAEYACTNEGDVAKKPVNLSFEEAAVIPTVGLVALGGIRLADVKPGQNVLIHGASGGVGSFVVPLLKTFGAKVTGVCSTRNVDMVRKTGADRIIDYNKDDAAYCEDTFDCIFAINGYQSIDTYLRLLKPGGILIFIGGNDQQIAEMQQFGAEKFEGTGKRMTFVDFNAVERELSYIAELVEAGKVTPVIDKVYPVRDVSAGIADIIENHAKGKYAITVDFS